MKTRTTIDKREKEILYKMASLIDDIRMADTFPDFGEEMKIDKEKNIKEAMLLAKEWSEI